MPYIGQHPFQEYTNTPTKDSFTGDGSTTAFDMAVEVSSGAENALEVYVNNIRQEPGIGKAFTLGLDGSSEYKRITFSTAPASGDAIYVINDKTNTSVTAPLANDLNGTELILDGDADTSMTADSDDRIDFKIGGNEAFSFSESSSHTIMKSMTDAKNMRFQQYDGRTILEIDDAGFVAIANGSTGPGQLRLYEDTDNGTNYTAFQVGTQSGDITYTLPTADGTSGYVLSTNASGVLSWANPAQQATYTATTAFVPDASDGATLGTSALEFSDLFLADGAVINLGDDQDTTLTHVADTGILLNSTRQLQFGDSGTYIHQSADGVLDLVSDTEIEINATTIDINGNVDISGTITIGSAGISEAELEILDGANVTTAELNILDGDTSATSTTVADADRVVMNDNGTMVQVAVTDLAAYFDDEITAMPNLVTTAATTVGALNSGSITSGFGSIDNGSSAITTTGTITGGVLTVDDVSVNGKVITMTGSTSDTATLTVGTNGTLDIVTTDDSAAAANIQITADGTAELAGTTVTLDSSGGITLDADGGTITFADAGSSLGTITSSGYSGTAAVATTVTVTDNESTDENNVITFVAGADADGGNVGLESDGNLTYNPSTGTLSATNIVVSGTQTITNSVTMNASNAVVFEGATADAYETTLTSVDATSSDKTISLPNVSGTLPVLAAASATAITSTPAELNIMDGGTSATATTVADADRVVMNDNGTMVQVAVTDLAAYFDDEITAMPNLTSVGTLTTLTVDDITINGSTISDAATLTIDVGGDINLDADGGGILFKDGGTEFGRIFNSSSDFAIKSIISDQDMKFQGNDGGTGFNALVLDMSAAGDATFNAGITATTGTFSGVVDADAGITVDNITIDGSEIDLSSGSLTLDVAGDIILDSGDGAWEFLEAGTEKFRLFASSNDVYMKAATSDKDIYFQGNDGGSNITMLRLDASSAGEAHFNDSVFSGTGLYGLNADDHIQMVNDTRIDFTINGNNEFRFEADGDFHADADVIAYSTTVSDERLKENIQPIEDALSKVSQLNGVTFTYKADGKESAGLIAQDVEKVLPSAISEKQLPLKIDDGVEYKVLQYDQTIGLLVEAIKELTAKVEELENK